MEDFENYLEKSGTSFSASEGVWALEQVPQEHQAWQNSRSI